MFLAILIIIGVAAGGFAFWISKMTAKIISLENKMNVITHNLESSEVPLLGLPKTPNLLKFESVTRKKIPIVINGSTYSVFYDATLEEFLLQCPKPDKAYGTPTDEYILKYYSSCITDSVTVIFKKGILSEIKKYVK